MKKLLLLLLLLVNGSWLMGQTSLWCENFDGSSISTSTSGTGSFVIDNQLFASAANAYHGTYGTSGGYVKLTSPSFSTVGNSFITLSFKHICKVDFTDTAKVEVSVNGGATWTQLIDMASPGGGGNCYYQGTSATFVANNKFSEGAYITWAPGQGTLPDNTWWKQETFDISNLTGNQADVMVRWSVTDVTGDGMGAGRYGWVIDDICVNGAPCELDAPTITANPPVWSGTIYNLGPFNVSFDISDASGIDQFGQYPDMLWTVNGGPTQSFSANVMGGGGGLVFNGGTSGNEYLGELDNLTFGAPFNDGDTICWWVEAHDASCAANFGRYPASGCVQLVVSSGITFPYCDNFESPTQLWAPDATNSVGTAWEWGTPTNSNVTTTAHSPTSVWGVGLSADYIDDTESYLLSPVFDFSTSSLANLSFWQFCNTENGWDGVRMEFTTDGGTTWTTIGSDQSDALGEGTNWYNDPDIGSSNTYAWTNTTGAWVNSTFKLGTVAGLCGSPSGVQFRFVFTSDGIVTDGGFYLDDLCIRIPPPNDVGVPTAFSPLPNSGQASGTSVTPSVSVENFGTAIQSNNFNVVYTVNGVNPVVTPFTTAVGPGLAVTVNLPSFAVLPGTNHICYYTDLSTDGDHTNDTLCYDILGVPTLTPTYCDDFEGTNAGWVVNNPGANVTTKWELGAPSFGVTNSSHSGNNSWDIDLASGYTNTANTELYTPFFDFSAISNGSLEFWRNHRTEAGYDGVRLEYSNDGGLSWNLLGAQNDPCAVNWYNKASISSSSLPAWADNSNGWVKSSYRLCCTTGILNNPTPVQFRFVFTSDGSVTYDGFSIDDFCIISSNGDDLGVSSITSPVGGFPVGASSPVVVKIENYGSTAISNFPVSYMSNGGTPVTIIVPGPLASCGSTTVTLPNITLVQGNNDICAWTGVLTDINTANDTSCVTAVGQPVITPTYLTSYNDNFDNGNIGWAPVVAAGFSNATNWELGYPNFGNTTGAHSGTNAWDINLNTAPGTNARCELYSPYFDMTNCQNAILRFWQNRSMITFGTDQLTLEYCKNNTNVWTKLGNSASTNAINWYNNADYWDDVTGTWVQSIYKNLPSATTLAPLVQFRFVYINPTGTTTEGVSIDDFEIYVPIPLSVTPVSVNISNPNTLVFPGANISFSAPIKNNGFNTVFLHNATLVIDGVSVSTDNISYIPIGGLQPDSVQVHNFATSWQASPGAHTVCVFTDHPNGTADLDPRDDTVCTNILVFDSVAYNQLPYCNGFESGHRWVTLNGTTYGPQTDFQVGKPNQAHLNATHGGLNAWMTALDSNYVNNDSSALFSALIRIQSGKCYNMSFWHQFRFEYGSDGGTVEISKDLGQTWENIDLTGTPGTYSTGMNTNYTYVPWLFPDDPSKHGFTGISNGFIHTQRIIRPDVDGQIILRWRVATDWSARDEGWVIDDFCFEDLGYCVPLGVNEFASNGFGLSQNYPNPANGTTAIDYTIPSNGQVKLVITDMIGQEVATLVSERQSEGTYTVTTDAAHLAPGMYNYTLTFEGQQVTKHMVITQ